MLFLFLGSVMASVVIGRGGKRFVADRGNNQVGGRAAAIAFTSILVAVLGVARVPSALARTDGDAASPAVGLTLNHPSFSPNADGHLDRVTATVTTDVAGALTLGVVDAVGAPVRTIAAGLPVTSGEMLFTWDGTDAAEATVPDGQYTLRATVVDPAHGSGKAEVPVVVDTRAPRVRWMRISPMQIERIRARVLFRLELSEPARARLVVTDVMDDAVHVDAWPGAVGSAERTWNLRTASGRRVPPGLYTVAVTATDDAANHVRSRPRSLRDVHPVTARTVRSVEGAGRRVALTFDDCGSESWGRILRVLRAHHVAATFFCSGTRVLDAPSLARRTVRYGNAVGGHGWDHTDLTTLAQTAIADRLRRDEAAWWRTTGAMAVPLFRPPYGTLDADVRRAAGASGYAWIALWSVDPRDWELPGEGVIASRVLQGISAGSIVVLHTNAQTAGALPAILRGLVRRDLEPVTMLELLSSASSVAHGPVPRMPV